MGKMKILKVTLLFMFGVHYCNQSTFLFLLSIVLWYLLHYNLKLGQRVGVLRTILTARRKHEGSPFCE